MISQEISGLLMLKVHFRLLTLFTYRHHSQRQFHQTSHVRIKPDNIYVNPVNSLQEYVEVPILSANNLLFQPSCDDMKKSELIFTPSHDNRIQYLTGSHNLDSLPDINLPEIAFIGRSNVGKSSLIKALFSKVPDIVVKMSKKPGHTRVLQFFQVGKYLNLVDMPGYGYNMPEDYEESVENYIKNRRQLLRLFLLIDASTGITKTDEIGLNMLGEYSKPYTIVLTKIDKVGYSQIIRNVMSVVNDINHGFNNTACFKQPFLVSSINNQGIPLLQSFIAYTTGNLQINPI